MVILKTLLILVKWLVIIGLILVAVGYAFVKWHPTFGGTPDAQSMSKMQQSPYFNGEVFVNLEDTRLDTTPADKKRPSLWAWLMSVTNPPAGKQPSQPLPSEKLNVSAMQNGDFIWLGHSTLLMKAENKLILTDPVFHRASPLFIGGKPFAMENQPQLADLPEIDIVLLSHDHYDHLDYQAIKALHNRVKHFYMPLGVKAHLQRWGVAEEKMTEMDWFETSQYQDFSFTLVPTRHYGGRRLNNRGTTLWGAWIINSPQNKIYFNGDSGYGKHFAQIGEKYGPFDIAFMENGAYNENWANIHMFPEQSAQALVDIQAKVAVPIHWAKFDLAYHPWKEPIEHFMLAVENKPYQVATPKIGQIFSLQNLPTEHWWETVE